MSSDVGAGNAPVYGCRWCETTAGSWGCPEHGNSRWRGEPDDAPPKRIKDALQELVKTWRRDLVRIYPGVGPWEAGLCAALERCADDIDALLAPEVNSE